MLKRNAKSKILSLCIFAAMLLFVIGILYFGYLMVMRAQWKGLKNDIADAINAASRSNPTFSIGDEALPFDAQDELYFSKFISDPYLPPDEVRMYGARRAVYRDKPERQRACVHTGRG